VFPKPTFFITIKNLVMLRRFSCFHNRRNPMIYGYARVSTNHQDTELQLTALKSAGCEKIFEEHASGRKSNRPVLKRLIATMQPGDELVVWKLDRIGRNVLHALLMFQQLQEKGINFRSITDGVDLKTASGRYNFRNILSAAQYESDLNSERTLAGLAVARAKGRVGGRRPKFTDEQWREMGERMATGESRQSVSKTYGVGLSTLYKKFPAS
jgi:DNA invertase Pin-like site-specific DNA recombinase